MCLPMGASGIAIIYSLDNVQLTLSFSTLVNIFNSTILFWNDAQIQADNPGVTLPMLPIVRLHRTDASGTTYLFTQALSQKSEQWRNTVGFKSTIRWPDERQFAVIDSNESMLKNVKSIRGAIGYVAYPTLLDERLKEVSTGVPIAKLINANGQATSVSVQSIQNAVKASNFDATLYSNHVDALANFSLSYLYVDTRY